MKTQKTGSGTKVLTDNLSVPLCGATTAKVDINAGSGNLTIDAITSDEQVLANGTLQYLEKGGVPTRSVDTRDGHAILTLKANGIGRPSFRFPWSACNGATEWQVHLHPNVQSDLTAHSDGGNIKLSLVGMAVTCVSADTGGGNMDVILPDHAADLHVTAKTGAGNVSVELGSRLTGSNVVNASSGAGNVVVRPPAGLAARIHAASGLGKVIVDPQFSKIDANTYQSPDYDNAADKVEITVKSGAGNVSVDTISIKES
jgi:hypothetical protein